MEYYRGATKKSPMAAVGGFAMFSENIDEARRYSRGAVYMIDTDTLDESTVVYAGSPKIANMIRDAENDETPCGIENITL